MEARILASSRVMRGLGDRGPSDGEGGHVDLIEGILKAGLMFLFLVVVVGAIAALFMVVFGIATGIDDRMQN